MRGFINEKSNFESLPPKIIYRFIKRIISDMDIVDSDVSNLIEDSSFENECEGLSKLYSIDFDYGIDTNFIVSTILLNGVDTFKSEFEPNKFQVPSASSYAFQINENRREWVNTTWELGVISYNDNLTYDTIKKIDDVMGVDYYSGKEINHNVYDGETISTEIDMSSISKLKKKF